jgi:hypothetical protein
MTVPKTLAVVLNPASGLELTSVIASRNDTIKRNGMTVPRTLAVVLNPASGLELTSVIGRTEAILRSFFRIASYLAMTNALYVNVLAMMQLNKKNSSPRPSPLVPSFPRPLNFFTYLCDRFAV